jgi:nucleoside-diphosphate-sugar epimerase
MYSIIVDGTRHLLDFVARSGCKRLLFISSGAVYGSQPRTLSHIPESHPCAPLTAYGKGKLLAEQLCADAGERHGFIASIARCFAFVGPYLPLDIHFAIGNFIRDCLSHSPIVIHGDGTPLRSYLDSEDLVTWLFTILLQGEHGRPYNVGSEQALSILDLARLVKDCAGVTNEVIVRQPPVTGELPSLYVPSTARARHELGLVQTIGIEEAICRTLRHHQQKDSP